MRLRGTAVVTLATGFNLVLTLGNQMVLAYLFGAGISMDAFLACGAVPFVVLNLAIGDLGYILIPLLMQYELFGDIRGAVDSTFSAVLALSGTVTLVGLLGHRSILHWTTSGSMPAATFELAVSLAPMMWAIIGLTILSSYLTGLHHYYRLFTAAAITLALPYLGMILGGLAGAHRMGIHAVTWGWAAGTLARTAILYVTLPRPWPGLSFGSWRALNANGWRHPATRALLRSLLPLGVSLLPFAALPTIDVFWASRLPVGSISYLGYSTRIGIAITSIVVQGLSVVLFPDLSQDAREGRLRELGQKSRAAMEIIFALIVPLAALAFLLREPLLTVFLQRGRFTAASSRGVVEVLPFYLLGTLPMAMMNIVSRSYFAVRDYTTPARSGVLALALYVPLCGLLIGRFSYLGIGMAYVVFWAFLFLLQAWLLRARLGPILNGELITFFLKVLVCAMAAMGVSIECLRRVAPLAGPVAASVVVLAVFLTTYLSTGTWLFRIPQYAELGRSLLLRVRLPQAVGVEQRP